MGWITGQSQCHHHGKGRPTTPTHKLCYFLKAITYQSYVIGWTNWQKFLDRSGTLFDENELLNAPFANSYLDWCLEAKTAETRASSNFVGRTQHHGKSYMTHWHSRYRILKMQVSMLTTLLKDNQNPNNHKIEVLSQTKDSLNGSI